MKRLQAGMLLCVIAGVVLFGSAVSASGRWLEERPGFCLSCHEMEFFGKTYQKSGASAHHGRCIFCHSGAGLEGVLTSQMTGLSELWTHFVGHPNPSRTYAPGIVPNENCLKCHVRGYNRDAHRDFKGMAVRFECAACHNHFENRDFSGQIPVAFYHDEHRVH